MIAEWSKKWTPSVGCVQEESKLCMVGDGTHCRLNHGNDSGVLFLSR